MPGVPAVVTLSASYGAGGSVVGPRVAEMLGITFLDRAIPTEVAHRLSVPIDEVVAHDDRSEHGLGALLTELGRLPTLAGAPPAALPGDDLAFKETAERVIHARASEGAVVLGRAGALVLADRPGALHVRLDGPVEARIEQAMRVLDIDEEEARNQQRETDPARDAYVKRFYRCDPCDAAHYHMVLDSTAIPLEACAQLIAGAVRARLSPQV